MVDDLKTVRNQIFKMVTSSLGVKDGDEPKTLKDVIGLVATIAGKGKDDVVGILCKEIGVAVAAMLKEPVNEILANKKLQFTLELVYKSEVKPKPSTKKEATKKKASKKKAPTSKTKKSA
jgi:hypothetical protein